MFEMATILPMEDRMKALMIADEIGQFHWAMLKSVLLILSLLPMSQGILTLWHATEGSSHIMVGFLPSVYSAHYWYCAFGLH